MIVKEFYALRNDGVALNRTYSDIGVFISRDGVLYEDAIDPDNEDRIYEETDIMIPVAEEPENQGDETEEPEDEEPASMM